MSYFGASRRLGMVIGELRLIVSSRFLSPSIYRYSKPDKTCAELYHEVFSAGVGFSEVMWGECVGAVPLEKELGFNRDLDHLQWPFSASLLC